MGKKIFYKEYFWSQNRKIAIRGKKGEAIQNYSDKRANSKNKILPKKKFY